MKRTFVPSLLRRCIRQVNVILVLYVRLLPTEDAAGIRTIFCQMVVPLMDQSAPSLWNPIHVNALLHGARSPTGPTIVRSMLLGGILIPTGSSIGVLWGAGATVSLTIMIAVFGAFIGFAGELDIMRAPRYRPGPPAWHRISVRASSTGCFRTVYYRENNKKVCGNGK